MHTNTLLTLAATTLWNLFPVHADVGYPQWSGETFCDGLVRPDYEDCNSLADQIKDQTVHAGPGWLAGSVYSYGKCQLRFVSCNDQGSEFETAGDRVVQFMKMVQESCGIANAGGVLRYGAACIVLEDPNNTYSKRDTESVDEQSKRSVNKKEIESASSRRETSEREGRRKRTRSAEAMKDDTAIENRSPSELEDRQCNLPPDPCFTFTQISFIQHARGDPIKVCDNVLTDKSTCSESRAHTITQSLDVGFEFGGGLFDAVTFGASFTQSSGSSDTVTLTTTIPVDCPGGSGYIVYYPYYEISTGRCGKGSGGSCAGTCYQDTEETCSLRRPKRQGFDQLIGEYGFQCI